MNLSLLEKLLNERFAIDNLQVKAEGAGALQVTIGKASLEIGAAALSPGAAAGPGGEVSLDLGPLAAVDGTVRAQIVDAHLLFDAQVTVPVRHGRVDFNDATVEHVGPDSRMGVSRLGLYVDAPNGRSYLYQFPAATVDGVEYERRGALLGPLVSDRGRLWLQPFAQAVLRQARVGGTGAGMTEQARLLLDRTALAGELQLGDGKLVAASLRAVLAGRAQGRNGVRLHSDAVGRGLTVEMPSLSLRDVVLDFGGAVLRIDAITAALQLRAIVEGGQLRFSLALAQVAMSGLRLRPPQAGDSP